MANSFLELYDCSFDDLYRYVRYRVGNRWDADDIVSESLAKAYEKFSTVHGDPRAWLFAIARNTITDFYRRRGKEVPHAELPQIEAEAESGMSVTDELLCLRDALQQLEPEQQELISLRYFAGLQHQQIAIIHKTSLGSVKMRVHRILVKVKEMVRECLIA